MSRYRYNNSVNDEQKGGVEDVEGFDGPATTYHDVDVFGHEEGHQVRRIRVIVPDGVWTDFCIDCV